MNGEIKDMKRSYFIYKLPTNNFTTQMILHLNFGKISTGKPYKESPSLRIKHQVLNTKTKIVTLKVRFPLWSHDPVDPTNQCDDDLQLVFVTRIVSWGRLRVLRWYFEALSRHTNNT